MTRTKADAPNPADARIVRVFVSSTFRDMHAERDALVTIVFPELRERLEWLGLELFDVDLRWGIPQVGVDGERANPWVYCKRWIDRVEPFFVGIIGQRYGWIPSPDEIAHPDDRLKYGGLSITHMEMRHAVASGGPQRRSFFYLRETRVPDDVEASIKGTFVDVEDAPLDELKRGIAAAGRPVRTYSCRWNGTGFDSLDTFAQLVLDDLWYGVLRDERRVPKAAWRAVLDHDPDDEPLYIDDSQPIPEAIWREVVRHAQPPVLDPYVAEANEMARFATDRTRWFTGRRRELAALRQFATSDLASGASGLSVVQAGAGAGKSSLLAEFVHQLAGTGTVVVSHFVGATERSADLHTLLDHLVIEIDRRCFPDSEPEDRGLDVEQLVQRLAAQLTSPRLTTRLVLVIDALDQLTDGHDARWLPSQTHPLVRIVVSCLSASATSASAGHIPQALERRQPRPQAIDLPPLDDSDVRHILTTYLEEYCKELTPADQDAIAATPAARNPLYLMVMLHELRTLGGDDMHLAVTSVIEDLPRLRPDTQHLFEWMLSRLEVFGAEAAARWWSYLSLGRVGMSGRELRELLQHVAGDDGARAALRIERSARRYLQKRGDRWDFFHGSLRDAVLARYGGDTAVPLHADIARYFEDRWRNGDTHAVMELPHHQSEGQLWPELEQTLSDLEFIERKCAANLAFHLVADYRTAVLALSHNSDSAAVSRVQQFSDFVTSTVHSLAARPARTPQLALNQPDGTAPARIAWQRWNDGIERRPWLRWINKPAPRPDASAMTLRGHTDGVRTLAYSPSGDHLISGSDDKTVRVWDLRTGESLATLTGHTTAVVACAWSPDGSQFASASGNRLIVWDAATRSQRGSLPACGFCIYDPEGTRIVARPWHAIHVRDIETHRTRHRLEGHASRVVECRYSDDGGVIVTAAHREGLRVWRSDTGALLSVLPDAAFPFAIDSSGTRLIARAGQRRIQDVDVPLSNIWDVRSGKVLAVLTGVVGPFSFSPDGTAVWTGSWFDNLRQRRSGTREWAVARKWDTSSGANTGLTGGGHTDVIEAFAMAPDGTSLLTAADRSLKLWNATSGAHIRTINGHESTITDCDFSRDGRQIASSAGKTVSIWETSSGRPIRALSADTEPVTQVAFSTDGRRVLGRTWTSISVWQIENGSRLAMLPMSRHFVSFRGYSPDCRRFVVPTSDRSVTVTDVDSGEQSIVSGAHWPVAVAPDGHGWVSAAFESARVWDSRTLEPLLAWNHHSGRATTCAYAPDGAHLAVIADKSVEICRADTGDVVTALHGHTKEVNGGTFSPDGNTFATVSSDGTVKVWDARSGALRLTWTEHAGNVRACAFSPDGQRVATASDDYLVKVWHVRERSSASTLAGHAREVWSCAFSPDGHYIASASADGTIRVWNSHAVSTESVRAYGVTGWVSSQVLSPDRRSILTTTSRELRIHDAATGTVTFTVAITDGVAPIYLDDHRILTVIDEQAVIVDSRDGNILFTLEGETPGGWALSADGRRLIVLEQSSAAIWDLTQRRLVRRVETSGLEVAVSPDGRYCLTAGADAFELHDMATGKRARTLTVPGSMKWDASFHLGFSPDGTVAAGCIDHAVLLWNVASGELIATLRGNSVAQEVTWAFSPDGRSMAFASDDAELSVWDVGRAAIVARTGPRAGMHVERCKWSPDGAWIASYARHGVRPVGVSIRDARDLSLIADFDSVPIASVGLFGPARLGVGDYTGALHLLELVGVDGGPPIATAVHVFDFDTKASADVATFTCGACGKRSPAPSTTPGSIVPCGHCAAPTRLNPFVVDTRRQRRRRWLL